MWFYGLSASIVLDLYELFALYYPPVSSISSIAQKKAERDAELASKRTKLLKQLVVDSLDLLVPGSAVGWIPLDKVVVGMAGVGSAGVSLVGVLQREKG